MFQIDTEAGNVHCLLPIQKTVLRNTAVVNKKALLPAPVAAAVEDDPGHKAAALLLIQKFADDVAGKVSASSGIGGTAVHVGPQISVQRPLGLFIGGLVEIPGVRLAQKDNLQRIDYGGLTRSVFPCQEVDILHLDELF